jgi:hypothetical protein
MTAATNTHARIQYLPLLCNGEICMTMTIEKMVFAAGADPRLYNEELRPAEK